MPIFAFINKLTAIWLVEEFAIDFDAWFFHCVNIIFITFSYICCIFFSLFESFSAFLTASRSNLVFLNSISSGWAISLLSDLSFLLSQLFGCILFSWDLHISYILFLLSFLFVIIFNLQTSAEIPSAGLPIPRQFHSPLPAICFLKSSYSMMSTSMVASPSFLFLMLGEVEEWTFSQWICIVCFFFTFCFIHQCYISNFLSIVKSLNMSCCHSLFEQPQTQDTGHIFLPWTSERYWCSWLMQLTVNTKIQHWLLLLLFIRRRSKNRRGWGGFQDANLSRCSDYDGRTNGLTNIGFEGVRYNIRFKTGFQSGVIR